MLWENPDATHERIRIGDLSFVAHRGGKQFPRATGNQSPSCFWDVARTGDYVQDCKIGERLALEYLDFEEGSAPGGGHLQMIVNDMPHPLTGVEIGFLSMISFAAGAGAAEARRVAWYWHDMSDRQTVKA
jgi:hypothetical protein